MNEPKKIPLLLRDVPPDVRSILFSRQAELKKKCNCMVSLPNTIYRTIREWHEIKTAGRK